ncbi:MAG: redoxin domain-containing protein [Planctomycetota bacterium]
MKNDHLQPRDAVIPAGEAAPDFTLLDQNRGEFKLSAALDKGDVVLCFFPMAFTDVCASEMDCIHKEMADWQAKGAQLVGVSCDSFAVLGKWAEMTGYSFPLLADMHREVCKAYGLYWADLNVASRGTVVVTKGANGPEVKWSQGREVMQAMEWGEVMGAVG